MRILWLVPAFLCVAACGAVAAAILLFRTQRGVERSIQVVLALAAWIQSGNLLSVLSPDQLLLWRQMTLLGEIFLPVALFRSGVAFIRDSDAWQGSYVVTAVWRWRALLAVGIVCALLMWWPIGVKGFAFSWSATDWPGYPFPKMLAVFLLLALVLALAQFEQVLRSSRDPLRYQMKFVLIGLGGLCGFSILQFTQPAAFQGQGHAFVFVSGLATLISVGLIGVGLTRWKQQDMAGAVYISPQALYTSLTFLIVGVYFILIGGLGEFVRLTGWHTSEAFALLLFFVGALGLIVVISSRQVKAELRLFLARHFYKSKYDYRLKWLEVIEAFRSCQTVDAILDAFLEMLGRTFGADRVTIWLLFEADGRFHQVRSVNSVPPPAPLADTHPLIYELQRRGEILEITDVAMDGEREWRAFLDATHAVVCVPLRTPEQLIGFTTLSHELRDQSYSQDDFDLLRSITHHITMLITQANLQEERTAAARWEAMSRFSTFCLHDLKTLTAGLSMVAQNAREHGHDPAFQESAMRTVTNTVKKMGDLISKLSARSKTPTLPRAESQDHVDINALVRDIVGSLAPTIKEPVLHMAASLSPVSIPPEQFKQLLLNLMMNANQAGGEATAVRIRTEQLPGSVAVTIEDAGPGIPESQLRTLFKPFKTSKRDGFGIGLYQCKEIVEQSKGKIRIESREGEGTKVCITLPAA